MWDLPWPGIEPVSFALQGGFLTTRPPGKPPCSLFWLYFSLFGSCSLEVLPEKDLWVVYFSSVQFSHSVVSDSLQLHGLQHARSPCPSPTPHGHSFFLLRLMSCSSWIWTTVDWIQEVRLFHHLMVSSATAHPFLNHCFREKMFQG